MLRKAQVADKMEVQEAVPPAGGVGAEPLSLMPQHFPREPAKRCFRAMAANQGFFDTLKARQTAIFSAEKRSLPARLRLAGRQRA